MVCYNDNLNSTHENIGPFLMSLKTIACFTSIPPRYGMIERRVKNILNQREKVDGIEIYLPLNYRRFNGERPTLPVFPEIVKIIDVEFDYGPATKILPAAQRWHGQAVDLLVCDDDRIADSRWTERLMATRSERPNDIIAERGWNIYDRFGYDQKAPSLPRVVLNKNGGRTKSYRIKRALSMGLYHPPRKIYETSGYVDVFEGFLGALVPAKAIPKIAYNIPDIIWTVDDVWISGTAKSNGFKTWAHSYPRPVFSDSKFDRIHALKDLVHSGVDREGADRHAVDYCRGTFGVWQ